MGVDDMIAQLELDELDFACDLELDVELFLLRCLWRNGVLLCSSAGHPGPTLHQVCK